MLTIYTDGACKGNPGQGGWAAILVDDKNNEKIVSGNKKYTTNNHMELLAVLQGLFILSKPTRLTVVTDSKYVVESFNNRWYESWIENQEHDRPNFELWRMIYNLKDIHEIEMKWVKGHSGHHYNERCDKLASQEVQSIAGFSFAEQKDYYAVAKGRTVGIFYTWTDCEKQVKGFKNGKFKNFKNLKDAQEFIEKYK